MPDRVRIVGSYLSPYVRKALVVLHLKGVAYEIDPIVPFMGDERFSRLSPLRRVPVLLDGDLVLADSTVICEYLEERHPQPALLPDDVVLRARARWFEEFADTRMGEVFIWRLFNQVAINPFVWGQKTDSEVVQRTLEEEIPHVLEYLESQAPAQGFLCGDLSLADIAVGSFFRNAAFARFTVDAGRWPRTAALVERVQALECFERLKPLEDRLLRTPIPRHRSVLAEMGAPLTSETYGTTTPRRGIMKI